MRNGSKSSFRRSRKRQPAFQHADLKAVSRELTKMIDCPIMVKNVYLSRMSLCTRVGPSRRIEPWRSRKFLPCLKREAAELRRILRPQAAVLRCLELASLDTKDWKCTDAFRSWKFVRTPVLTPRPRPHGSCDGERLSNRTVLHHGFNIPIPTERRARGASSTTIGWRRLKDEVLPTEMFAKLRP